MVRQQQSHFLSKGPYKNFLDTIVNLAQNPICWTGYTSAQPCIVRSRTRQTSRRLRRLPGECLRCWLTCGGCKLVESISSFGGLPAACLGTWNRILRPLGRGRVGYSCFSTRGCPVSERGFRGSFRLIGIAKPAASCCRSASVATARIPAVSRLDG
jgi:hypothetical protein